MFVRSFSWPSLVCYLSLLMLLGCQTPTKKNDRLLLWPLPPDLPRFIYETTFWSPSDIARKEKKSRWERFMRMQEPPKSKEGLALFKPYDIAISQGKIYITDTAMALVHVYNLASRRFFRFAYRFEGKLEKPAGITVDESGLVYVADVKQKRIVVYDAQGLYLRHFSHADLQFPTAVAVSAAGIYVVDRGGIDSLAHQVLVFDAKGKLQFKFGKRGYNNGEFNLPIDVVTNKQGEVFVLDAGNFRVQVFSAQGKYLRQWGSVGRGMGQFARPRSLAVDAESNIYVSDAIFGNVQIFNAKGQLLLPIGERYEGDQPGHYPLISGITVDERGNLLILDQYFRKLEVLRRLQEQEGRALLRHLNKPN